MSVQGSVTKNPDETMDVAITAVKEHGDAAVSAGAFMNNVKTNQYSVAGGFLGVSHADGHSASLTGQHIPTFGKQVTAATNVRVLNNADHQVNLNAYSTQNIPKGPMPAFQTYGGGADYQYKDTLTAGASVSRTPLFKQTDYTLQTGVNLNNNPTSSFNLGAGLNRTDTQFGRGNWEKKLFFGWKKTF